MNKIGIPLALVLTSMLLWCVSSWADSSSPMSHPGLAGSWEFTIDSGLTSAPGIEGFIQFDRHNSLTATATGLHSNSDAFDVFCACNASHGYGAWESIGQNKYAIVFKTYLFASATTFDLNLDLTAPLQIIGQHIGYSWVRGEITLEGRDQIVGTTAFEAVNLDGKQLNPDVPPISNQTVTATRMKVDG